MEGAEAAAGVPGSPGTPDTGRGSVKAPQEKAGRRLRAIGRQPGVVVAAAAVPGADPADWRAPTRAAVGRRAVPIVAVGGAAQRHRARPRVGARRVERGAMASFRHHIFICTNTRPPEHPRGSCNVDGSGALRERFAEEVKRRNLRASVRANAAGCLDQCEHGPTVVVYPEGVWYGNVRLSDVAEILESHIVGGRPVERLRLPEDCLNTKSCAHKLRPAVVPVGGGGRETS